MEEIEVDRKLIQGVDALYKYNKVAVKVGRILTNKIQTTKGLLQRCFVSTIFYVL